MKPLILLLLFTISVEAQSLSDAARKERERKAASARSVHVFTSEDARNSKGSVSLASSSTPAPPLPASAKPAAVDLLKKYNEDLLKLRTKITELQDKDTALQLQINELRNSFLAPQVDLSTRSEVQAKLDQAQAQLTTTQSDLADTKKALQELEAKGPPKP